MQIKAVELENAKSYEYARVEFADGVNAIVGHNGAGKSTILEAIGLVLFDALEYTRSEFVRNGARTATMTVEVESNLDGRPYHVVRRMGGVNQHYVHDPELDLRVCEGKADVLAFLRQHMGVDGRADLKALFRDAVGVAQGTFTAVFLETASKRKTTFDSLLQVEEYQNAVTKLLEPLRLVQKRGQELDVSIAAAQARLERLPGLEQEMAARGGALERIAREAAAAEKALATVAARRDVLEAARQELASLQARQGQTLQRQEGTRRQMAAARLALADAETAWATVEENQEGSRRYLAAQQEQKRLDARLRERTRLEEQRAAGDKAVALAESVLERLQRDLREIEQAHTTAESLAGAVEAQERLETALAEARQQAARLREVESRIAKQQQQIERLSARRTSLQQAAVRAGELEAQQVALQSAAQELQAGIDRLRQEEVTLHAQANRVKEQSAALQNAATALCPVCEQPLTSEHRQDLLARNEQDLDALRDRYRAAQADVKQASEQLAACQREIAGAEKALRSLPRADEVEHVAGEIAEAETELANLRAVETAVGASLVGVPSLTAELAELGDPRSRYAVAWERAQQADRVQQEMREKKSAIDERLQTLAGIQAQLAQFADLDAALDATSVALRTHEAAYQAALSHQRMAATLPARQQEAAALEEALAKGKAELERLAVEIEEAGTRFDAEAYQQAEREGEDLRERIGGMRAQRLFLLEQQQRDEREIGELRGIDAALADAQKQRTRLSEQEGMIETVRAMLRQAGPYITSVLIRQISDNARQIFGDIMQDHTRHLAWNEDYGITLEVDGHVRQFQQLSGGEQMIAALAVRLALLRELSAINVAFFDEPTANLDETRRESLARRILEVKGFRQLFVISHDDTFEQATQNLIRVERVNGISRVVEG